MKHLYPACFYPEKDGQYSVFFPDLDNISTYGNSLEDAIEMAQDLLCTWIIDCKKDGTKINPPSILSSVKLDSSIGIGEGFVNIVVGDIDNYLAQREKSVKKTVSLPAWLADMAREQNINCSQTLQRALRQQLNV